MEAFVDWVGEQFSTHTEVILAPGLSLILILCFVAAARRWVFVSIFCSCILLFGRIFLVRLGLVYGQDSVAAWNVMTAAALLGVAFSLRRSRWFMNPDGTTQSTDARISSVAGVLALPVAAIGLVNFVAPTAPSEAGVPACDGAPALGGQGVIRTGQSGLNARSGPSSTYPSVGRFDVNCALAVDGYCVGEGVSDVQVPLPDVRWLRLHNSQMYVSAAKTYALTANKDLGDLPETTCPGGTDQDPSVVSPPSFEGNSESVVISASAVGTRLIGFSYIYLNSDIPDPISQLGDAPKRLLIEADAAKVRMDLLSFRVTSPEASGVVVAVTPCLGPGIASHTGTKYRQVNLTTGENSELTVVLSDDDSERLRQAACRVNPSFSNEEIQVAAEVTTK